MTLLTQNFSTELNTLQCTSVLVVDLSTGNRTSKSRELTSRGHFVGSKVLSSPVRVLSLPLVREKKWGRGRDLDKDTPDP